MKYSGIGGQAVMEGVMMKNQEKYAVAVRKPDHEIEVKVSEYTGIIKNKKIRNMPILRGVFSFIESLVLGMQTLTYSASFFEDEEEKKEQNEKKENFVMGLTVAFSVVLAVLLLYSSLPLTDSYQNHCKKLLHKAKMLFPMHLSRQVYYL